MESSKLHCIAERVQFNSAVLAHLKHTMLEWYDVNIPEKNGVVTVRYLANPVEILSTLQICKRISNS